MLKTRHAAFTPGHTSCSSGILVACTRQHRLITIHRLYMSRSTCIRLYLATDGRQTDDDTRYNHVDGDKWIQLVSDKLCPGVNAA